MPGRRNVNQAGASANEAVSAKTKKEVLTASTEIVGANGTRTKIIFSPVAKTIFLSLGAAAAAGEGIELSKESHVPFALEGWTGKVFAIGAEATSLAWSEF